MKKFLILFLVACTTMVQAQDAQQWTMFSKVTATWCPFCGQYGWDMFEGTLDEIDVDEDNVLAWTLHYSGDLINDPARDIASNFGNAGQPNFFVNNDDINVNPNNVAAKIEEAKETASFLNDLGPLAKVDIKADYNGTEFLIAVDAEFLSDVTGEYFLSVFLVEDNVINFQQSQGPNANHRYVLRQSLLDDTWGKNIITGDVSAGFKDNIDLTFPITIAEDEDVSDYHIVSVIWNKDATDTYRVINMNREQVQELSSATKEIASDLGFATSSVNGSIIIEQENASDYEVQIYGLNGQKIYTNKAFGNQEIDLNLDMGSIYLVHLIQEGRIATEKILIK